MNGIGLYIKLMNDEKKLHLKNGISNGLLPYASRKPSIVFDTFYGFCYDYYIFSLHLPIHTTKCLHGPFHTTKSSRTGITCIW